MVRINEMEELQMDNMESRAFVIKSESNPRIRIEAVPGHFVTSHSHINYCLNITQVKHEHAMARDAAAQLAAPYLQFEIIDTIVCLSLIHISEPTRP